MTVTIELKPETEKHLAEQARRENLEIETFLEVFIEKSFKNNGTLTQEKPHEKKAAEEWIANLRTGSESHDRTTPFLSDEATRRENIY